MKTIYKIAKAELQTLFYSPVAWLILIIFAFQTAMGFAGQMEGILRSTDQGYNGWNISMGLFGGWRGVFTAVQQYLFLYIPLLTMGLMSREYASGSIKLLYSSPITNTQIILGKYLSMMIYGLALIGILILYIIFSSIFVKEFDIPAILSGLLGLYLLICAYSAIGLFMSSITSYQVVAAMGTLALLAVLNFVGTVGQDIEFVRDITFWLSIQGRCSEFVNGLICSEDVMYFLIVIVMFLMLAISRVQAERRKSPRAVVTGKYIAIIGCAMLLGYLSSRPKLMFYHDATATKMQTLTPNSQDVIANAKGNMMITTYDNLLDVYFWAAIPKRVNEDLKRFKQYRRFKPEIKFKYVYYWDKAKNPDLDKNYPDLTDEERAKKIAYTWQLKYKMFLTPDQIKEQIDLKPEGNRFVRLVERESGEKTFLRIFDDMQVFPGETEITAAFKRLCMTLPCVGFLTGHGERDSNSEGDREYKRISQDKPFRYALINQGFDFENVTLHKPIPDHISILVIAEMKQVLTDNEMDNLKQYIERGGNMFILGEPKRREVMNPVVELLGVEFLPGSIVKMKENFQPDLQFVLPTKEAGDISYRFGIMRRYENCAAMPGVAGLKYTEDKGYKVTPLFVTDTLGGCWNELQTVDFIDEVPELNPETGEREQDFTTAIALSRMVGDKEQRIMIFGDADCLSNSEVSMSRKDIRAANFYVMSGSFFWLSNDEVPIDDRRPSPPDNNFKHGLSVQKFTPWKIAFMGVIPFAMLISIILIWIKRKGR